MKKFSAITFGYIKLEVPKENRATKGRAVIIKVVLPTVD
jgi:hypothetical protein